MGFSLDILSFSYSVNLNIYSYQTNRGSSFTYDPLILYLGSKASYGINHIYTIYNTLVTTSRRRLWRLRAQQEGVRRRRRRRRMRQQH